MDETEIKTEIFNNELRRTQYDVSPIPYHVHNQIDSPAVNYPTLTGRSRFIVYRAVAPTTVDATGTKVGGDFVFPFGGNFVQIGATVDTAGTTGSMTIDFLLDGVVIGSTVTIVSGSKTSRPVPKTQNFTTKNFDTGDILTFNVTAVHTTPALGLTLFLRVTEITP